MDGLFGYNLVLNHRPQRKTLMRALDIEDNIEHLRYNSKLIARQRRRVGDLGENVAEVFGRPRLARVSMSSRRNKACLAVRAPLPWPP
jgi:hypothetical protein